MNETIRLLIENIDAETRWALKTRGPAKCLLRTKGTAYSMVAEKKAKQLGIHAYTFYSDHSIPMILDHEQFGTTRGLTEEQDPDNLCQEHRGMSCVAEAVYLTLACTGLFDSLPGLHVALVGRGHAVKGLGARLLARDATVTVCHSKTRNLGAILKTASVVVYCADTVDPNDQTVLTSRKPAVLDVSGAAEKAGLHVYASASDLGKLNVSILMNRIATGRR